MKYTHDFHLRDFQDRDTDDLARLWRDSWASTGLATPETLDLAAYRERIATEGRRDWRFRLACGDDGIRGFVAFQLEHRWLRQLFVRPSAQRNGLGTVLLDTAKAEMPGGFWLWTDANNQPARRFYERHGCRLHGEALHPAHGHQTATYGWP